MGLVVRLSDFRKPGKALPSCAPEPEPEPAYYCMGCNADLFKLFPSGLVKCTDCGAVIRNIVVTDSTNRAGHPKA
jgi:hypothetical protein